MYNYSCRSVGSSGCRGSRECWSVMVPTWSLWWRRPPQARSTRLSFFLVLLCLLLTSLPQVVGAATLVVEDKFIHECGTVGRVEDVVVSGQLRGRQLGKLLLVVLTLLARERGCYKVTLNCNDRMVEYYKGLGFLCEQANSNYMVQRL